MADSNNTKPELSAAETKAATKQGLKDAVAEKAKIGNAMFDDLPGDEPEHDRFHGSSEVLGLEPYLTLGPNEFETAVGTGKDAAGLSDVQKAALYKLERNGQNRTPYVKALRKALKLKDGEHVPGAGGPAYTNDVTATTDL